MRQLALESNLSLLHIRFCFAAREGNIPGVFSTTTLFRNPGIYAYRDQQYGNLMTGTVYVSSELGNTPSSEGHVFVLVLYFYLCFKVKFSFIVCGK
jgi:hypothetical protein